jgi:hypothetical protein
MWGAHNPVGTETEAAQRPWIGDRRPSALRLFRGRHTIISMILLAVLAISSSTPWTLGKHLDEKPNRMEN